MAGPYYTTDQNGMVKLTNALPMSYLRNEASSNSASNSSPNSSNLNKKFGFDSNSNNSNPNSGDQPSPKDIELALEKAQAGDQNSIDWLTTLGIIGGGVTAAYLLSKLRRGNKDPNAPIDAKFKEVTGTDLIKQDVPVTYLETETVPRPVKPKSLPPQPKKYLNSPEQGKLTGPPPADLTLTQQDGQRNPVGPTVRDMEIEAAYLQKKAQDAKAATREAETGRAAKALRLRQAADAFRRIIR
ncbi:MAG: hypothetical protein IM561_09145 [Microcystis sp. M60BS1]|uniref:hypothetical protein n=1 Tax=unclassified Microcystis TaxID=2643300 RepID=UPI00257E004E|nr:MULTISPECIES: hypothetical protein [unclassified Microcystis]MCA2594394.1 hypothetical protein [Microcystis sp. M38BS1]MCA6581482.1 hypothetical protein [Pseudanabaena sp. M34BS1SP1A06MG]MCA2510535.1 hypothetical protein [Microcystis sp. M60BS1]MCA2555769.1 hypothetical protein [Microcystis sp. M43BS1]MCA2603402.1 hypothetical protein [Microcystis sp. M26BS1]